MTTTVFKTLNLKMSNPHSHIISLLILVQVADLVSPRMVSLTSSLNTRSRAYPNQEITFTCVTKGSHILSWSSEDYIGRDLQLEFTSIHELGSVAHSSINSGTIATLTSVTTAEDGGVILESTLRLLASSRLPSSSIICHHVGNGLKNSTTLHVKAVPAQEMNGTLRQGRYACPGDNVNFTCETRDSQVLAWSSDVYIGVNQQIEFLSIDREGTTHRSPTDPNTIGMLIRVYYQEDTRVMISNLSITVVQNINSEGHSIACINVGVGTRNIATFYLADDCDEAVLSTDPVVVNEPTEKEKESNIGLCYEKKEQIAAGVQSVSHSSWKIFVLAVMLLLSFSLL